MNDSLTIAVKFWERTADESVAFHKRGDDAVKFYIGAGTALAAWLLTQGENPPAGAFAVLALGVFGAGHVSYYHNRGYKLMLRATRIAKEIAKLAEVPSTIEAWSDDDKLRVTSLLTPGHPVTQILFNALVTLAIHLIYALVLIYV